MKATTWAQWRQVDSRRSLKTDLLSDAGLELLRQERWSDLERICWTAFDVTGGGGALAKFWLHVSCLFETDTKSGTLPEPRNISTQCWRLTAIIWVQEISWPWQKGCFSVMGDDQQARRLLDGLPEPEVQMRLSFMEETLRAFEPRLWREPARLSAGRSTITYGYYS